MDESNGELVMREIDVINIFVWMENTKHPDFGRVRCLLEDYKLYPRSMSAREVLEKVYTDEEKIKWAAAMRLTGYEDSYGQ